MAVERSEASVRFESEERAGGRATVWTLEGGDAHRYEPSTPSGVRPLWENGRFVYARVGRGVVMASTSELLDRAIAAYDGGGDGLLTAGRGGYRDMRDALVPGAQWALLVSPAQLREALRPALEEQMRQSGVRDQGVTADELFDVFGAGAGAGLVASARYDGRAYAGSVFVPFDWDKAAALAGRATAD